MYEIEVFEPKHRLELQRLIKAFKQFEGQYEPAFKLDNQSVQELYNLEMIGAGKHVYSVRYEKEMVGFIAFGESIKNDPLIAENIPVVYISALFVLERHRGEGLAQRLMQLPEDFAKAKNIKFLKLLMFTRNQLARDFYFKSGFENYESTMIKEIK